MRTVREELIEVRNKIDELIKLLETRELQYIPRKQKGRPKSVIFHEWVDIGQLAQSIRGIHLRHFNKTSKVMEVNEERYGETDFMLCIYYALVKFGLAPSLKHNQVNKQYYSFLKNQCRIALADQERTFNNHLNKVLRTGCDLHDLNPKILSERPSKGAMKPDELDGWKRMLADAERLLLMDDYVISLANK